MMIQHLVQPSTTFILSPSYDERIKDVSLKCPAFTKSVNANFYDFHVTLLQYHQSQDLAAEYNISNRFGFN